MPMDLRDMLDDTAAKETGAATHQPVIPLVTKYDRLFIVTYGRSGSTLLQGLLNAIAGYRVLGENFDTMRQLEIAFNRLPRFGIQRASGKDQAREASQPTHPFYGFENFITAAHAQGLRLYMEHMLMQDADPARVRCLGFKEIRYTPEDIARKVDFLRTIFPGCGIIYNIRDPKKVVESEFQRDKEVAHFEKFNTLLEERAKADPHAFLVRYEDVVKVSGSLPALYDFLGERFDRAQVEAVLAVKHSYHTKGIGQVYSDVPRFVAVNKSLQGFKLFVTDRYLVEGDTVTIAGLMHRQDGAELRRFKRVLDEVGRPVKFKATLNLPSPRLTEKLKDPSAGKARFLLSFARRAASEYQVFLDDGTLAMTVTSSRQSAADPD